MDDYSMESIPVHIKFDFINGSGIPCVSGEWIEYQMNMRACDEFDGWLEVTCCPMPNDKLSSNLLIDLDIEHNLKCGPVASRTMSNVYGLFWTVGMNRCKLFFAFQNKAIHDNYTAYLENVLRSLKEYRIEQEVDDMNVKTSHSFIELGNNTQDMSSMPIIVDRGLKSIHISDAFGISHEVQLRQSDRNSKRRVRRPIAIIADLLTAKRANAFSSAHKMPPINRKSIDDFEIPKPKSLSKINRSTMMNKFRKERKWLSLNSVKEPIVPEIIEEQVEWQVDIDQGFGKFVRLKSSGNSLDVNNVASVDEILAECSKGDETDGVADKKYERQNSDISMSMSDVSYAPAPTFSTFGKIAKVDENGYAIMRPIIREECIDFDYQYKTDSLRTTCVSIYGDVNFKRNIDVNLPPTTRKTSFDDQSSSGCSSDSEDQIPEMPPKHSRFSDGDFTDEAISLKYNSPSSSPTKLMSSQKDLSENDSFVKPSEFWVSEKSIVSTMKRVLESSTPHKINNNMRRLKPQLTATTLYENIFVPHSPVNIRRPIIIKPDSPTESNEEAIHDDYDCITETSLIDNILSVDAVKSMIKKKWSGSRLMNDMNSNIKLKAMRFLRTYTDIREMTISLVSLPQAMHNFV